MPGWLSCFCCYGTAETRVSRASVPTRTFADAKNSRHLIVDDSSYNRLVLRRYLNGIGVHVDEVEDAESAIRAVEIHGAYAVIWLDLRLATSMNGAECCQVLRNDYGYPGVIIALTGYVDADTHALCLRSKMTHFMGKPFNRDKVRAYTLLYARPPSAEKGNAASAIVVHDDPVTTFYADPAAHHALMAACPATIG